jgi:uncharacterized protein (TIGR04551 family)
MSRLLTALVVVLALAGAARAQEQAPAPAPGGAAPSPAGPPLADPKVQAAIDAAVAKAKEEIRNEVRAELQGQQSAQEFMGTVAAEQPKLELLDLDGYFRVRGDYLNKLHLKNSTDTAGWYYFPKPLRAGEALSSANMRLRLEPTINASETVRVHMQIDVLDNYVLGSNTNPAVDGTGSPYPIPFYGSTRTYIPGDPTNDRDLIIPRRVWAEVQTPVGLLSFGRMPSHWGLGIMANAGTDLDADFGDTVDRIQFALPPVSTPIGRLVFVPIYDFDTEGVLYHDPHGGAGSGQPLDADNGDDARTLGLKIIRLDTDDEIRRKVEGGGHSFNFGLYYNHRTQRYVYPAWLDYSASGQGGFGGGPYDDSSGNVQYHRRGANAHFGSFWTRWVGPKWRIESELVGVYGDIEDANSGAPVEGNLGTAHINMRQWGGVLQLEYKQSPKVSWGFELGAASGDSAPGFGNLPNRGTAVNNDLRPNYGAIDGPQWGRPGDFTINNFRFNPAYLVDNIFYRRILGQITDSVYLRPSVRWRFMPGLVLDASLMYAQAQIAASTPSSRSAEDLAPDSPLDPNRPGHKPLAVELDSKLTFTPSNGFTGWLNLGAMKPLDGMDANSLAWMIEFGMAARF